MSSTSPEEPLGLDLDRPIPGTWAVVLGLVGAHVASAVLYGRLAGTTVAGALFLARGLRLRVTAGGQYRPLIDDGQVWRLVRSVWLHADFWHLAVNVLAVWVLGRLLEPWTGATRLAFWFVLAGVGGSLASHGAGLLQSDGASGGAFGLLGALGVLAWRNREHLDPRDRRTLLVWLPVFLIGNLVVGFVLPFVDGIAHLGGLLVGCALGSVAGTTPPGRATRGLEALGFAILALVAIARISIE